MKESSKQSSISRPPLIIRRRTRRRVGVPVSQCVEHVDKDPTKRASVPHEELKWRQREEPTGLQEKCSGQMQQDFNTPYSPVSASTPSHEQQRWELEQRARLQNFWKRRANSQQASTTPEPQSSYSVSDTVDIFNQLSFDWHRSRKTRSCLASAAEDRASSQKALQDSSKPSQPYLRKLSLNLPSLPNRQSNLRRSGPQGHTQSCADSSIDPSLNAREDPYQDLYGKRKQCVKGPRLDCVATWLRRSEHKRLHCGIELVGTVSKQEHSGGGIVIHNGPRSDVMYIAKHPRLAKLRLLCQDDELYDKQRRLLFAALIKRPAPTQP